tara:strand:+ start:816 stop:1604 length:789 start_codon:yes stop_codon:yes gene_type:complete
MGKLLILNAIAGCSLLLVLIESISGHGGFPTPTPACGLLPNGVLALDFSIAPDGFNPPRKLNHAELVHPYLWALWGITVTTNNPTFHKPQILNSALVVEGENSDLDLGTPNEYYGGPGVGHGGEPNMIGENAVFLGNLLIISEKNTHADDYAGGGNITFSFAQPMSLAYIDFVDIDLDEVDGYVVAYDRDGGIIMKQAILALGNNAYIKLVFEVLNVKKLVVHFAGSGGMLMVSTVCLDVQILLKFENYSAFDDFLSQELLH